MIHDRYAETPIVNDAFFDMVTTLSLFISMPSSPGGRGPPRPDGSAYWTSIQDQTFRTSNKMYRSNQYSKCPAIKFDIDYGSKSGWSSPVEDVPPGACSLHPVNSSYTNYLDYFQVWEVVVEEIQTGIV